MLMSGKQAFYGKGEYTTALKILWGRLGYRKKNETNFCRKKLGIIKVFNTGYLNREGEWILSNSLIEKAAF